MGLSLTSSGDFHNDIIRMLDGRLGHILDFDLESALIVDGLHRRPTGPNFCCRHLQRIGAEGVKVLAP